MDEKLRILLCEDDENLGMLLREYLQAKGYSAELYLSLIHILRFLVTIPLALRNSRQYGKDGHKSCRRSRGKQFANPAPSFAVITF